MPLDPTEYLTSRGWAGLGMPLDGQGGRGLKKPLAIPQKRDVKGLGKNRDRANEWWDCIFEAGAKTLKIGLPGSAGATSSSTSSPSTSGYATPPGGPLKPSTSAAATPTSNFSLASQARREWARKALMSGFVRGQSHASEVSSLNEGLAAKEASEMAKARKTGGKAPVEGEGKKRMSKEAKEAEKALKRSQKMLRRVAREKRKREKEEAKGKEWRQEGKKRKRGEDPVGDEERKAKKERRRKEKEDKKKGKEKVPAEADEENARVDEGKECKSESKSDRKGEGQDKNRPREEEVKRSTMEGADDEAARRKKEKKAKRREEKRARAAVVASSA